MNYLTEQLIKQYGLIDSEYRINQTTVKQTYFYKGQYFNFEVLKPESKPDFKQQINGGYTMSKLQEMKKNANTVKASKLQQMKAEKTIKEQPEKKAGLTIEGLAMVKDLRKEIDSIKSYTLETNNLIKEQAKIIAELKAMVFNNGNDEIIELLKKINVKQAATVKPETVKPETVNTDKKTASGSYDQFKKYFSGNCSEDSFNMAMKADFTTIETLKESLKAIEKQNQDNGNGFLCARKSKKPFIAALWQIHTDSDKPNSGKTIDKSDSPVFDSSYFSDLLEIDNQVIVDLFDIAKTQDSFSESFEEDLIDVIFEENEEVNEEAYEEFITFLKTVIDSNNS
jgi:hypothetical protein